MMSPNKKISIINIEELTALLAKRTGLDQALIETIIYYYERTIIQKVMHGDYMLSSKLFKIYHINHQAHIEFSDMALKYINKGKT
jgi:hypothetical protein